MGVEVVRECVASNSNPSERCPLIAAPIHVIATVVLVPSTGHYGALRVPAEAAVADASRNAQANGVTNASFVTADLDRMQHTTTTHIASSSSKPGRGGKAGGGSSSSSSSSTSTSGGPGDGGWAEDGTGAALPAAPDVIVVDPARSGLSTGVVAYLMSDTSSAATARRLVYVSCNVATQVRHASNRSY